MALTPHWTCQPTESRVTAFALIISNIALGAKKTVLRHVCPDGNHSKTGLGPALSVLDSHDCMTTKAVSTHEQKLDLVLYHLLARDFDPTTPSPAFLRPATYIEVHLLQPLLTTTPRQL